MFTVHQPWVPQVTSPSPNPNNSRAISTSFHIRDAILVNVQLLLSGLQIKTLRKHFYLHLPKMDSAPDWNFLGHSDH